MNARKVAILEERVAHYTPLVGEFFGVEMPSIKIVPYSVGTFQKIGILPKTFIGLDKKERIGLYWQILKGSLFTYDMGSYFSEKKGYIMHTIRGNMFTEKGIIFLGAHELGHIGHHELCGIRGLENGPFLEVVADYVAGKMMQQAGITPSYFDKQDFIFAEKVFSETPNPRETIIQTTAYLRAKLASKASS